MTEARVSKDQVQVVLTDVQAQARVTNIIAQVVVRIPTPEPEASLATQTIQVAVQIRRGTLSINGGHRRDIIDAHDRVYVTGMSQDGGQ